LFKTIQGNKAGLEINFSKTEELIVNTTSQRSIMLANKAIRRVHDWKMEEHVGCGNQHPEGQRSFY
jgi:hypothetical protein